MSLLKACGAVAVPLLLVSIVVVTIGVDRGLFWWRWWRRPDQRRRLSAEQLRAARSPQERQLVLQRCRCAMAQGEPFLQAAVLLAPMLGLLGTVLGLMDVLRALGPQLLLPSSSPLAGYADVLASTVVGLQLALLALVLAQLNRGLRHWQLQQLQLLELELRP